MTVRKQIGMALVSAISLLLLALVLTFTLTPHWARLALAEWNVRRHFPDARQITTEELGQMADRGATSALNSTDQFHDFDLARESSAMFARFAPSLIFRARIRGFIVCRRTARQSIARLITGCAPD